MAAALECNVLEPGLGAEYPPRAAWLQTSDPHAVDPAPTGISTGVSSRLLTLTMSNPDSYTPMSPSSTQKTEVHVSTEPPFHLRGLGYGMLPRNAVYSKLYY